MLDRSLIVNYSKRIKEWEIFINSYFTDNYSVSHRENKMNNQNIFKDITKKQKKRTFPNFLKFYPFFIINTKVRAYTLENKSQLLKFT